ncbi:MAG: 50S ribosomal protein L37ae [Candidatus Aenigmarchaeota archaeon]|nr:50S ribosomal protein L37ae [Candidatus Aenigmarchaeota archaeon]
MHTKKVGSAGRFGPRYGKKVRDLVRDIEKIQKKRHVCPRCDLPYVERLSKGIFYCKKCNNKFTGQAYYPRGS